MTYPTTEITYTVDVDGEQHTESYTTDDVSDERAAWDPDVALAYARHLAVDEHGFEAVDVNTVDVTHMGDPHDQFDETGGTPL